MAVVVASNLECSGLSKWEEEEKQEEEEEEEEEEES